MPLVHVGSSTKPLRCAGTNLGTKHLTGGEVRHVEKLDEPLALRPLPSAGRSNEDDPHENPARDNEERRHAPRRSGPGPSCGSGLLQQSGVVPHHEMTVDLLDEIEGHTDGDQQAGTAVETSYLRGDTESPTDDCWNDGHKCEKTRSNVGDPLHDPLQVVGRPLAG